ncbi:MAG: hypothetical protein ACREM3_00815 [Candidatus Rokuibacteriota bacterium]
MCRGRPVELRSGRATAQASRKDAGNLRFDALTQDRQAFEGHVVAGHVRKFREALTPMSGSLCDERLYTAIE